MPTIITAGVFVITKDTKQVLACHATNSSWAQWSIPKGLVEHDETLAEAATRELKEETGIDLVALGLVDNLKYLGSAKYLKQNKKIEAFVIEIPTLIPKTELKCTSMVEGYRDKPFPEVDTYSWLSLADAKAKLHESQQSFIDKLQ